MTNTKRVIVILIFSCLLCFTFYSSANPQVLKDSTYFPLQIGDRWVFSSQNDTLIESVADTQLIGGNLYYSFEKFRDLPGYLFRMFEGNVFIYADTAEYLWYDFNADSGDSWILPPLGHPYSDGLFTMQSKTDTVVTSIETFTDCYCIQHFIGADAEFVEWFAPGVGIVQRDVITIAGLKRWILVDRITTSVRASTGFAIPKSYSLSQNYPNPFNPTTKIKYNIPSVTLQQAQSYFTVTLKVYDVLGNEIATLVNEEKPAGTYEVEFNDHSGEGRSAAGGLTSGVYLYKLTVDAFVEVKKMVFLK